MTNSGRLQMRSLSKSATAIVVLMLLVGYTWHRPASSRDAQATKSVVEWNVVSFGAVGDGQADDTAAIQSAVDSGIGRVRLPKGIFRISKPIVIDLDKVGYTSISGE